MWEGAGDVLTGLLGTTPVDWTGTVGDDDTEDRVVLPGTETEVIDSTVDSTGAVPSGGCVECVSTADDVAGAVSWGVVELDSTAEDSAGDETGTELEKTSSVVYDKVVAGTVMTGTVSVSTREDSTGGAVDS